LVCRSCGFCRRTSGVGAARKGSWEYDSCCERGSRRRRDAGEQRTGSVSQARRFGRTERRPGAGSSETAAPVQHPGGIVDDDDAATRWRDVCR
jgi:hypothetical protein